MADFTENGAAENSENVIPDTSGEEVQSAPEERVQSDPPDGGGSERKQMLKIPLFAAVIAVLAAAVLASMITFLNVRQSYHTKLAEISKSRFADSKLSQVDDIYRNYYINGIDDEKLVDGLIDGYIYGAGDKYGNYMSKDEYEAYSKSLDSKAEGIGVSVIWDTERRLIEVISVYADSPAEEAGMLTGDLIYEVDGKSVSELGFDASVSAIKGESGTKVNLTVLRGGSDEQIHLTSERRSINISTVIYDVYGETGVIKVSNFYASTPDEVKAAVSKAQNDGCKKLIFDMRNNSGGLLKSVEEVLDYLLPEGVVVRRLDASGKWTEYKSDAMCVDLPMAVIVNEHTASAAELFTSALMDFDYAKVVGTQTYGKGTVTAPYTLSDGSVIYISIEHYYPPESDNFEGKGITPDIVIDLSDEAKKINFYKLTPEQDAQLQKALEILK